MYKTYKYHNFQLTFNDIDADMKLQKTKTMETNFDMYLDPQTLFYN